MSERDDAIRLANKVLETPNRDPDDDLSMLSRQFLRALEREATPTASLPAEGWIMVPKKRRVRLDKCPVGLFLYGEDCLGMKTEYGNNEGRIDAFIVSSGEFFWGPAPQTIERQRAHLVWPIDLAAAPPAPAGLAGREILAGCEIRLAAMTGCIIIQPNDYDKALEIHKWLTSPPLEAGGKELRERLDRVVKYLEAAERSEQPHKEFELRQSALDAARLALAGASQP